MEYYGKIWCVSHQELVQGPNPIMSEANYKQLCSRGQLNVVRPGKGLGNYALIEVATMPQRFKDKVDEKYGDMKSEILRLHFQKYYNIDPRAREYYTRYRFENGDMLPSEHIREYTVNASALNAVVELMADTKVMRKVMNHGQLDWNQMAGAISYYQQEFGHTLPVSANRFRNKVKQYREDGYESLISRKFRNQNRRKVTWRIDNLIKGLKAMTEHPYDTVVAEMYNQFVQGKLEVFDPSTGEVFDPAEFRDKKGNPLVLSKSTIAQYLNEPLTSIALAKVHQDQWSFNNSQRPYHMRNKCTFAGSQISLDDRDLPRKMHDGSTVKTYLAFDVMSGAIVGYAYGRKKNDELFLDCMRSMFKTCDENGFATPAELQVEHHITSHFKEGLLKDGVVFQYIRWCNPGNSREKHAERFHRDKKYGIEKQTQPHTGRWYAKLDEHRTKVKKVFDEDNNTYIEPTFSYEELVADEIRAIRDYNMSPHPDQKKFPGLSKWDVFCLFQNPVLQQWDKAVLMKYIGRHVTTSIKQNAYITVQYNQYRLSHVDVLKKLAPRNNKVDAYYLPDENGEIGEIYIYQNDRLIDTCKKVVRYNTATIEQTEKDKAAYTEQAKYNAQFDAMVKKNRIQKLGIVKKDLAEAIAAAEAKAVEIPVVQQVDDDDDYSEYMNVAPYSDMGEVAV